MNRCELCDNTANEVPVIANFDLSMDMNDLVIISVDDHISEPPDMFDRHVSGDDLASAPKLRTSSDGTNYWEYQGMKMPSVGLNAVVGRPLDEYGMEPTSFGQLRKGVYDVHARIDDMNVNGVAASLNFGTAVGFDGGRFHKAPDKAKALVHMRAKLCPGGSKANRAHVAPDTAWASGAPFTIEPVDDSEHELRAWSSRDGKTWVKGGVWTLPAGADVRVGLVSHGGAGATAKFAYFRLYR